MLFNSFEFIFFLPLVIILYYLLPHKLRWVLLLCASYYFYMAWKPEYVILIILSTIVDYYAGIMMEKQTEKSKRKKFLILSLVANLGMLFIFKYFNFFNAELGKFYTAVTNNNYSISSLKLLLPMGISFYTFQTLSYTIDVYRGKRGAEHHLGYFALYVTYFPQLVAGPIERSNRLLPQLKQKHKLDYNQTMSSILRISWGFFKKVIIADRVAVIVNSIYGDLPSYSGIYLIIATIGFAIQIYCDFSAYSDIAIGSAKLMGIDLMENFKVPYLSKSIGEFWSRWHISLSTWFRDYLYIPLGGNRVDKRWKYYKNVLLVFLISGFWHGANWTFLIWGGLHGFYQIIERTLSNLFSKQKKPFLLPGFIKLIITFSLVMFAWIFFRADNIKDAFYVISNIIPSNYMTLLDGTSVFKLGLDKYDCLMLFVSVTWLTVTDWIKYKKDTTQIITHDFLQGLASVLLILFILIFGYYGAYDTTEFIYFQF
jgi:alginate O-acetyltransferase complex protein AlgI